MVEKLVSITCADIISSVRAEFYDLEKRSIADAMCVLTKMINLGADDNSIGVWSDDLMNVMEVIASYNETLNAMRETKDSEK